MLSLMHAIVTRVCAVVLASHTSRPLHAFVPSSSPWS